MQHFIGVKLVQAELEEREGKKGYHIVDAFGNDSWLPEFVFESIFMPIENPYQVSDKDVELFSQASHTDNVAVTDFLYMLMDWVRGGIPYQCNVMRKYPIKAK